MEKAVVFGAGGMGVAIAYAMYRLGFDVQMVDPDKENATLRIKKHNVQASLCADFDDVDLWAKPGNTGAPSIVISAAPYHQNLKIAKKCFERGWRYCDLGGDPNTSRRIARAAKKAKGLSFTDLGLAPGLANIIAEAGYKKYSGTEDIQHVHLKVGGLPVVPKGSLQYGLSWSADGLYNEYKGDCHVLHEGQHSIRPALGDTEWVTVPYEKQNSVFSAQAGVMLATQYQTGFQAFNTKGGLASTECLMAKRGVKFSSYKTLRHVGHRDLVNFLINECKLTKGQFGKAIRNACEVTREDVVYIIVDVNDHRNYIVVKHDLIWTAMQKCTAFPAAAVAAIMATGQLDGKGSLNYSDIPIEEMAANLEKIGGFPKCLNW